jgi:hypothetical protein
MSRREPARFLRLSRANAKAGENLGRKRWRRKRNCKQTRSEKFCARYRTEAKIRTPMIGIQAGC